MTGISRLGWDVRQLPPGLIGGAGVKGYNALAGAESIGWASHRFDDQADAIELWFRSVGGVDLNPTGAPVPSHQHSPSLFVRHERAAHAGFVEFKLGECVIDDEARD